MAESAMDVVDEESDKDTIITPEKLEHFSGSYILVISDLPDHYSSNFCE